MQQPLTKNEQTFVSCNCLKSTETIQILHTLELALIAAFKAKEAASQGDGETKESTMMISLEDVHK